MKACTLRNLVFFPRPRSTSSSSRMEFSNRPQGEWISRHIPNRRTAATAAEMANMLLMVSNAIPTMAGLGTESIPKGPLVRFLQVPTVRPTEYQLFNALQNSAWTARDVMTKKSPDNLQAGSERARQIGRAHV